MTNMNLLELAVLKDNTDFYTWFRERLGVLELRLTGLYRTGEVFDKLLGVSQRSYLYWENNVPSYPVKEPYRVGDSATYARAYLPAEVVDISYWYFLRKLAEDADVFTVEDIAEMLFLTAEVVMTMMAAGSMSGTGQSVGKEQFKEWLHSKVLPEGVNVEG